MSGRQSLPLPGNGLGGWAGQACTIALYGFLETEVKGIAYQCMTYTALIDVRHALVHVGQVLKTEIVPHVQAQA